MKALKDHLQEALNRRLEHERAHLQELRNSWARSTAAAETAAAVAAAANVARNAASPHSNGGTQ